MYFLERRGAQKYRNPGNSNMVSCGLEKRNGTAAYKLCIQVSKESLHMFDPFQYYIGFPSST
jgi:hypothetical protein